MTASIAVATAPSSAINSSDVRALNGCRIETSYVQTSLTSVRGEISRRLQVVLIFLLHRHCDIRIRGESDLVALHTSDEALVDEMMVAFMGALAAIPLRQLDAPAFDLVHRANMDPIGGSLPYAP